MSIEAGVLYVVATPIGNLADITYRAVEVLQKVDLIAAEDTRHSGILLKHYGVATSVISLHDHNEQERMADLITRLQGGQTVALISDAGTPLISDPGFRLVRECRNQRIKVSPIPGPSALTAGISVAGIASDRFAFEGFLPAKEGARRERLKALSADQRTLVFYESSHRIHDCLRDMATEFGDERTAVVGREMTKAFETFYQGALGALVIELAGDPNAGRGEFVVIVASSGSEDEDNAEADRIFDLLRAELPLKQAAKLAADITGKRKNDFYKRGLADL